MPKFEVTITETLKRKVTVEAEDKAEAMNDVRSRWDNSEIILAADDFAGMDMTAKQIVRKKEPKGVER